MNSVKNTVAFCLLFAGLVLGEQHVLVGSHLFEDLQFEQTEEPGFGIIGGEKTSIHQHPYQAAIYYGKTLIGSGAILNKNFVITSALPNILLKGLTVVVGETKLSEKHSVTHVEKLILHPEYSFGSDLAVGLLKLKTPLKLSKTVRPIKIAKSEPKNKSKATVSGWGIRSSKDKEISTELRQLEQKVLTRKSCKPHYPSALVSTTSICAYHSESHKPYIGDNGDPLVQNGELIGVFLGDLTLIRGVCAHPKLCPSVYTDVVVLRNWIEKTINNHHSE